MKYIFDFDDVLFDNTKGFKNHMYMSLEKAGVPRSMAEEYYKTVRGNQFWLKELLAHFSLKASLYNEILSKSRSFTNQELLKVIKKLGKKNCYIVTHGNKIFQRDKIKKAGLDSLFSKIIVVSDGKKEAVEKICAQYKDEKIFFIDDKLKHFENLNLQKCPNLKTILYNRQGIKDLLDF